MHSVNWPTCCFMPLLFWFDPKKIAKKVKARQNCSVPHVRISVNLIHVFYALKGDAVAGSLRLYYLVTLIHSLFIPLYFFCLDTKKVTKKSQGRRKAQPRRPGPRLPLCNSANVYLLSRCLMLPFRCFITV